jgi:L-2,4-diaminobutyrate decarboxylase
MTTTAPHAPALPGDALAGGADGTEALTALVALALAGLREGRARRGGPVPSGDPGVAARLVAEAVGDAPLPERGVGAAAALRALAQALAAGAADPADALCAAHLHCPPLAVAVAADLVASAVNPSLDSWDQGPAAVAVEDEVLRSLAGLVGFDPLRAAGTMTTGGSASNLMALLLAREHIAAGGSLRVVCSELAHFSVARAAAVLGLGDAVVAVPVDSQRRLRGDAVRAAIVAGTGPAAVVATAGTTDFGSIDALGEVARAAREAGAWLHVDAAYGGGALLSRRLAPLLDGIELADSVGLDLHKLGWQPIAAGVLLVAEQQALAPLERRVAYLNAADDEDAGYPSLLGRSLRTTRRVDALKLAVTFRALGRRGLGDLVDRCHDLARHAAASIGADPRFALEAEPILTSVVFRYVAGGAGDAVNARARRRLLREGTAVVGRTEVPGPIGHRVRLKLTLLNPHATTADVDALLEAVADAGAREARS